MARAIERIERDIAGLKEAIKAIAVELHGAYVTYLTILGQALQKQLILASYYLCTQGYPERFLQLSLNQRQKLQQGIRQLGQQAATELLDYIHGKNEATNEVDPELEDTQIVAELATEAAEEIDSFLQSDSEDSPTQDSPTQNSQVIDLSNPLELLQWQQELEAEIQEVLKKLSHEANNLIQKTGILPKKLPEPLLAAAAAAASEASAEVMPGPPNLLNLVIEITNEQDSEDSSLAQIMAIHMRLGEIEFADAALLSERKQIRNILVQLNKLGREYQKRQRELKIAAAEAAWRASWYED
jgi:hypothetical protein